MCWGFAVSAITCYETSETSACTAEMFCLCKARGTTLPAWDATGPTGWYWGASCRSRQSNPRLQGSRSRRHHAADDSNDGVRLHPRSPRDFGHDSRHPDGFNRLFPECGSGIQNHQLGKRGTNRRHAADVARAGENRSIGIHIQCTGKRFGQLRSFRTLGRHLLYHLAAHHVHQQHGYGGASCPDCPPQCRATRHQSRPVPVCGSRRRKHVFRLPVFHTAQCAGHARRTIYIYGLRKGRASASNHHGYRNGICASVALPVLSEKTLRVRPLISTHRNALRYRLRKATLPHKFSDCSNKKAQKRTSLQNIPLIRIFYKLVFIYQI